MSAALPASETVVRALAAYYLVDVRLRTLQGDQQAEYHARGAKSFAYRILMARGLSLKRAIAAFALLLKAPHLPVPGEEHIEAQIEAAMRCPWQTAAGVVAKPRGREIVEAMSHYCGRTTGGQKRYCDDHTKQAMEQGR